MPNRFLLLTDKVILNDTLRILVNKLDYYFGLEKYIAYVTSGIRTREQQLDIILKYAKEKNIYDDFSELKTYAGTDYTIKIIVPESSKKVYWWQRVWSKLLNLGIIVSPLYPAECLYDYINPVTKENKKGKIIPSSAHFTGKALDISGEDIRKVYNIVNNAYVVNKNLGIKSILLEHNNNCVHINVF